MGEEFASQLETLLRDLRQQIDRLVDQMQREGNRIVSTQVNLGIAQRSASMLEQSLDTAGYRDLVEQAYLGLPALVEFGGIAGAAAEFAAFDVNSLEAFRLMKGLEMTDLFDSFASDASQIILRGALGGQSRGELVAELMELLDETRPHAATLYETALSDFVMTLTALRSDNTADEKFLYTGPIDMRIRPFCLAHVGRVYTRAEIDGMTNGQLPNTFITRGGYNCRHQWRRVSQFDELAALADTGRPASERIAGQLEEVSAALEGAGRRKGTV